MFFELFRLPDVSLIRSSTTSYVFASPVFPVRAVRQRRDSRNLSPGPQTQDRRLLCRLGRVLLALRAADAVVACSRSSLLRTMLIKTSTSCRTTSETRPSPIRLASSFGSAAIVVFAAARARSAAVVRRGAGASRGAERTRYVAQSVEALAISPGRHLGKPVLDVLPHQPGGMDHAARRVGDLGTAAAHRDSSHVRSAGIDDSVAVG